MSTDANKSVVHRFYEEVWNKQDMDAANHVLASNYAVNGDTRSPEIFKEQFQGFRPDWSELHLTIEDMVAEGDKVSTRWTMHGIWRATGKPVTAQGISLCRIVDGKIQDYWFNCDPWE